MNDEIVEVKGELVTQDTDALSIIAKRGALFDSLLDVALKSTHAHDWIDEGGKPYLQSSGAEKVARRFGIVVFDTSSEREEFEDEGGKYYMFTVTGKIGFNQNEFIQVIGTCTTRDKFLCKKNGAFKKLQDIDISSVKKKAYTNFMNTGIQKLIGLRNLTWEGLSKYGIGKGGKQQVQRKTEEKTDVPKIPMWTAVQQGKSYLFAKSGRHFGAGFLEKLGFKKSQKQEGTYWIEYTDDINVKMLAEYADNEKLLKQQEAANGAS